MIINEDEDYEAGENGRLLKPVSCLLLLLTIPLNPTRPHVTHDDEDLNDLRFHSDLDCIIDKENIFTFTIVELSVIVVLWYWCGFLLFRCDFLLIWTA